MDEIPKTVLDDLMTLGKLPESEKAERNRIFSQLKPFDSCGRTHANAWISATENLNIGQLSSLARGLVYAEESLAGWNGGSVSGVIWIFKIYQKQTPENADELANWILEHSKNDFVPYGSNRAGTKSVTEFAEYRRAKEQRHIQTEKRIDAEQRCKVIRKLVARRHQQESATIQKAKAQARLELLAQLDNLPTAERLEHIAWDDEHDLTFYPERYADVTPTEFDSLDEISHERLISKIKPRLKGCWVELFTKITK
jgi:hypothetical protein